MQYLSAANIGLRSLPRWRGLARGLTLLEIAIVLVVVAVLASLALPSMARQLERQRLHAAAEVLVGDLTEARFEAARRGVPLHLEPQSGAGWCWVVSSAPGCSCTGGPTCVLKSVRETDHPAVRLLGAQAVRFDTEGRADRSVAALFEAGGDRLRVDLSVLGRSRVCDPDGRSAKVPRC